jgi:hypothetical protein
MIYASLSGVYSHIWLINVPKDDLPPLLAALKISYKKNTDDKVVVVVVVVSIINDFVLLLFVSFTLSKT